MNCTKRFHYWQSQTHQPEHPLKNKKSEIDNAEITSHKHLIESNYFISDFRLQQFKDEIKSDETLQTLFNHTQNIWPKSKNGKPNLIQSYFIHWQDLTYSNYIQRYLYDSSKVRRHEDMKHHTIPSLLFYSFIIEHNI